MKSQKCFPFFLFFIYSRQFSLLAIEIFSFLMTWKRYRIKKTVSPLSHSYESWLFHRIPRSYRAARANTITRCRSVCKYISHAFLDQRCEYTHWTGHSFYRRYSCFTTLFSLYRGTRHAPSLLRKNMFYDSEWWDWEDTDHVLTRKLLYRYR